MSAAVRNEKLLERLVACLLDPRAVLTVEPAGGRFEVAIETEAGPRLVGSVDVIALGLERDLLKKERGGIAVSAAADACLVRPQSVR